MFCLHKFPEVIGNNVNIQTLLEYYKNHIPHRTTMQMPRSIPMPPTHPRVMKYTSDVKADEFHSTVVTLNT